MRYPLFLVPAGVGAFGSLSLTRRPPSTIAEASYGLIPEKASSDTTKYDRLLDWLGSSGGEVNDSIEIKPSTRGGGFGAFANGLIRKDEILFTVPRQACMTLDKATADPDCGEAFRRVIEKAGPGGNTVVMAGYIAQEYLKYLEDIKNGKTDSAFGPYFATLPWERGVNSQEHVLFWTDEMVEELLKDSVCYDEAKSLKEEVELAIKVISGITNRSIRRYRGEDVGKDGITWPWESRPAVPDEAPEGLPEAVKGAFVCLLTRAFQDGEDEEKLVPLLDMLQHSDYPNIRHAMRKVDGTVEVRAREDIQAGDELLNQYRSESEETMPYARFFTRFGFVPGITDPVAALQEQSTIFFPQAAEV